MSLAIEWDLEELSDYLRTKGLHEDIVAAVYDNRITGSLFVSLTENAYQN